MVYLIAPLAIGLTFAAVVAYRERWRGLSLLSMLMAGGMCGLGALSRDPSESLELLVGSASKAVIASVCSQVSQGLTLENGVKVVSGAANFLIADGPNTRKSLRAFSHLFPYLKPHQTRSVYFSHQDNIVDYALVMRFSAGDHEIEHVVQKLGLIRPEDNALIVYPLSKLSWWFETSNSNGFRIYTSEDRNPNRCLWYDEASSIAYYHEITF